MKERSSVKNFTLTKYRRKVFYEEKRLEVGAILRKLCEWRGVNIIEAEVCVDQVHMLVEIPPKMSISSFMGYLKGKSSLMIFEKWGNMKYKYRNREFWCRGYYVDTVGKNTKKILITIHSISNNKINYQETHHLQMLGLTFKSAESDDVRAYADKHFKELEKFNEQLSTVTEEFA